MFVGRNKERLEIAHKKCTIPENHLSIVADITDENDRQKLINEAIDKFGRIDVLVNNAGIYKVGNVENFSMDDFDAVFNTNLERQYC